MRLLVSWMRDFVDARVPAQELGSLLSMRGFEVAAIEAPPPGPLSPDGSEAPADDAVIDFEITANRPDALSVIGLAREAATTLRLELKLARPAHRRAERAEGAGGAVGASVVSPDLSVFIDAPDLCPRYAAALAEVKVGPSPEWMANRLTAAGVRPINNVVDVTNYVLIEMGHPLHAFDLERLGGRQLRARRARAGERLRTLDGEVRALEPEMLVIADGSDAQAVAGVMGGATSEVWSGTRVVALESAYFKPTSVRRTSKRLGLKTEASSRFERGADISVPVAALERALELLELIGGGRRRGEILDVYAAPRGPVTIRLRRHRIAGLLGTTIADTEVEGIFAGLGFEATPAEDGWDVLVPTARVDIMLEADLIEEVGRHHGFDRIPSTFPTLRYVPARPDPSIARAMVVRRVMIGAGLSEAISYTFIDIGAARPFVGAGAMPTPGAAGDGEAELVPLAYPLSENFAVLRPSLVPGLVDSVARNKRHGNQDVRLFEIGSCFTASAGEHRRVALAWAGAGKPSHWAAADEPVDFFHVKGVVEQLGETLRLPVRLEVASAPWLVAGRTARVMSGETVLGLVGQLSPEIAAAREVPGSDAVYVAELDLEAVNALATASDVEVSALPRFPSVVRDISIVVDEGLPSERVRATIRSAAPDTLESVREFDRYRGKGIPDGSCSLSLRLTFRSAERTLTDTEIQQAMERVVQALSREHQAVQR